MDGEAIQRIRQKGLPVLQAKLEEIDKINVDADIFLCFELLEHLTDPSRFLYKLSLSKNAKYLVVSVPYLKKSRVGLQYIRTNRDDNICAENTHIFEFNPEDWKLLIRHSGWEVIEEIIYLQYPKRGFLRVLQPLWRKFDFEGFYGLVLKKDNRWSKRYKDW